MGAEPDSKQRERGAVRPALPVRVMVGITLQAAEIRASWRLRRGRDASHPYGLMATGYLLSANP
jgi:hypothetical protein